MEQLPKKPDSCVVEDSGDTEGVTLLWPLPVLPTYYILKCIAGFLCMWSVGCFVAASVITRGGFAVVIGWSSVAMWTAVLVWGIWKWSRFVRSSGLESVRLEADWLRYTPGRIVSPLTRQSRTLNVPRSEIRAFRLEHVGERQRLSLEWGANRLEIGAHLKEPEREWMFEVLQTWHSSAKETSD